jgi:hypothetical protein
MLRLLFFTAFRGTPWKKYQGVHRLRMKHDRTDTRNSKQVSYCNDTVQLVPPAGSALISPVMSMQKPRWPVLPTA